MPRKKGFPFCELCGVSDPHESVEGQDVDTDVRGIILREVHGTKVFLIALCRICRGIRLVDTYRVEVNQ
jgi:hypothetical protein